jgi:hypothetical protein
MIRRPGIGTKRNLWTGIGLWLLLSVQGLALGVAPATGAPKAEAWSFLAANDPAGKARVDHTPWDRFLVVEQVADPVDRPPGPFGSSRPCAPSVRRDHAHRVLEPVESGDLDQKKAGAIHCFI